MVVACVPFRSRLPRFLRHLLTSQIDKAKAISLGRGLRPHALARAAEDRNPGQAISNEAVVVALGMHCRYRHRDAAANT